ncbi:hypothetical protein [Oceanobacillus senegalensis]|uniref:hypothetical protein n=1 Tax=Oceanobacillus senegalensis TaxID=1936063 RepID=UPI000A304F1D|nr:hypothetical protein [Oceanobacillus senegalensis]
MKLLKCSLSLVLIAALAIFVLPSSSFAANQSTDYYWESGCDRDAWPYDGYLEKYNPCKIYVETTYFSKDDLSKLAADLGYTTTFSTLTVGAWEKIATQMLTKTSYTLGITGTVAFAAETMYRGTSDDIVGWNIEHHYNYEIDYAHHDTFPTKHSISIDWVQAK